MLVTTKDIKVINGMSGDDYHVTMITETTLTPESVKDRDDLIEFVSLHVPTIEEDE